MPIRLWGPERQGAGVGTDSVRIAALANGGFVMVWQDYAQTPDRIMYQVYGADGAPTGAPQSSYMPSTPVNQSAPSVTALYTGGFVITQTTAFGVSDYDIESSYYTASGAFVRRVLVSSPTGVQTSSMAAETITSQGDDATAFVWADENLNSGDIRFAIYSEGGTPVVGPLTVNTTTTGAQHSPVMASRSTGIAIAWVDNSVNGGDIRLRVGSYTGGFGAEQTVNTSTAGSQRSPSVIYLSDGRIAVTWIDAQTNSSMMRIYTFEGAPVTGEISLSGSNYAASVNVASLKDGGLVAVSDAGDDHTLQFFNTDGTKRGPDFLVPGSSTNQGYVEVEVLSDGRILMAWDNSFTNVRFQILDPRDGSILSPYSGAAYGHNGVDDEIRGQDGANQLYGLGGDDILYGREGNDRLFGGEGYDTAFFGSTDAGTTVTRLAHGTVRVQGTDGIDMLRGVERIELSDRNFSIRGYAAADVNGDGDSDIITYSQSTGIVTRLDMQDGFQIGSGKVGEMGSSAWRVQQTGDFNYDGNSDLVLKNASTGQFYIWTQFGGMQNGGKDLGVIGTSWDVVSTGDYNADGRFDILWRNGANGQFYVWTFNSAMAQTGSANLGILGTNWTGGPSGDFDGDGDSDVLLRDTSNGQFYIYTMQNGAQAGGANLGILGTAWTIAEVGDFNGDMRSDIALKNTSTGQFYLWLMNADLTYTGANLGNIGTDWNIAATGDYNADGTDDLLWRNTTTGQTYLWTMEDGRLSESSSHHLGFLVNDLVIV